MRQTKVCSNRVFVPGVHASPRRSEMEKEEKQEEEKNDVRFRLKRMVWQAWAHELAPLNLHWLVLTNGGTNFYDCWLVDSI